MLLNQVSGSNSRKVCASRFVFQRGLSLIEVMVAVVVLSIGLLGMAALTGVSVRNTQSANYRTQATNLAYDVVDMMRANKNNVGYYNSGAFSDPAVACADAPEALDPTACGIGFACDIARWEEELCRTLPLGRGSIGVAVGGVPTTFVATVRIRWCDDRSQVAADGNCAAGETEFAMETNL